MAQELSNYNINLMYTYVPSVYTNSFNLPSILLNGGVDGVIVLNVYDPQILTMVMNFLCRKYFLIPFLIFRFRS